MQGNIHGDEWTPQTTRGHTDWRNERTLPSPIRRTEWQGHSRSSQEICTPCFAPRHRLMNGGDCIHQCRSSHLQTKLIHPPD